MPQRKLKIYLVGAIEFANNYGRDWRSYITPKLEELEFQVINPCILEHKQIKEEDRVKFPVRIMTDRGRYKVIHHWHDLYLAVEGSKWKKAFKRCMLSVMNYDLNVVKKCDVVLCFWDDACERSVGSHGELTLAYLYKKPVVLVKASSSTLSRWAYCCAHYGAIVNSFKEAINYLRRHYAIYRER